MIARRRLLTLLAVVALSDPVTVQAQVPLAVLAAASLKEVMDAAAAAFTKAGGPRVRMSYAASSALARQIEAGAPADLFISADKDWMDYLAARGLIDPTQRYNLVTNHLALIAPKGSKVALRAAPGMALAAALGEGRLALAGPDVPAGRYARAALEDLGVWPSVEARLAPADNVRGALLFVARGEAPLGIVYDTDAKADPRVRIVDLFPENGYPKIVYPAAVLKGSSNLAARRFLTFLRSPAGTSVFRRYGFTPLP